jgi:PAS domain S-box-containing protein
MRKSIKQWLNPPFIGSDEEKTTQARFLSLIIWASWGVLLIVLFISLFYNDWQSIGVVLAGNVLLIAPFVLLRRGHVAASSLVFVLILIGTITLASTVGQGIYDLSIIAFPIIFIFAGLTMSRGNFRLCVGVSFVAISWLAFGEDFGWFATRPLGYPNWLYLISLSMILLVGALAVELLAINMRKNLDLARREISERMRTEEALRESEAYLKFSQQVARVGHWIWNIRTNHVTWSDEMKRILGLDPEQYDGNLDGNLNEIISRAIHPDDREKVEQNNQAVIQEGKTPSIEFRIILPDQTMRFVWAEAGDRDLDADGNIIRLMGIVQDITERKQTEEIALASQKLAGIGRLAAGMAHEINSPLQVVTGISERLTRNMKADQIDTDKFLTDINTINRNGWRIANIVRSLLTYSRQSSSEIAPQQLNDIINSTLLLIEHQLKSWSSISVDKELAPDLPLIHCDSNGITQILINLLENARDAMPGGGFIKINTSISPENGKVTLRFSDTGKGISVEEQSRIFDPFFTTKEVGKGTGLGLSIVHGIIETHGGEITVESAPGKGTTFSIGFPEELPALEISGGNPDNRYS